MWGKLLFGEDVVVDRYLVARIAVKGSETEAAKRMLVVQAAILDWYG
jgi:hypothetical protein